MSSLKIPMNTNIKLELTDAEENEPTNEDAPYMNMVGALRYAADCTRPDISYVTSQLARYLNNYKTKHLQAVEHVYRYLKGSADKWLILGNNADQNLIGYSDADGSTTEGNRGISGYLFSYSGSTISWSTKRQSLVSLSTAEAELYALSYCTQEALSLRFLIEEIINLNLKATVIYTDNQAVLHIVNNPERKYQQRTKHINIRKEFFKEKQEKGLINIQKISTNENLLDIFTKVLYYNRI